MASLAQVIGPAAGLLVLGATGFIGSFALASAAGLAAAVVLKWALAPETRPVVPARRASFAGLVEYSAVRPMLIESLWVAVNSLFVIFPPVLAAQWSGSVVDLAGYYATVGIVLIGAQVAVRRRLDKVPRDRLLFFAIAVGFVAILIASQAASVVALTVAGCVWAIGSSPVSPIAMASAIDRAPKHRRGSAMATYSLGHQLGYGAGALTFGLAIDAVGYPAPYYVAGGLLALLLVLVSASRQFVQGQGPCTGLARGERS
jgi:predicted MFS family arabinose efflux permease